MSKIVYLFGAGASRNALPIVNEIPKRLKEVIIYFESEVMKLSESKSFDDLKLESPKTQREFQLELIDILQWLLDKSSNHASVDTFAKKLFIKGKVEELEKLRMALSVFFACEQLLNKTDNRYDTFYASILEPRLKFPDRVRILSWNYDYQFELAFSEYSDESDVKPNRSLLNMKTKFAHDREDNGFGIYQLNGTTCMFDNTGRKIFIIGNRQSDVLDKKFIESLVRNYAAVFYLKTVYLGLSFSWEEDLQDKSIVDAAIEATSDAKVLVIIGYSFPFFNRDVDRKIINSMKQLEKVYFQSPEAEVIRERFQAIRDDLSEDLLVLKKDTEQFLLPNEL